jgi:hypothetical protein
MSILCFVTLNVITLFAIMLNIGAPQQQQQHSERERGFNASLRWWEAQTATTDTLTQFKVILWHNNTLHNDTLHNCTQRYDA